MLLVNNAGLRFETGTECLAEEHSSVFDREMLGQSDPLMFHQSLSSRESAAIGCCWCVIKGHVMFN